MKPRCLRRGLTILEILFGMAILALLTAVLTRNLRFATHAARLNQRLDVHQRLRLAELRLRAELETGTAVLHPAEGAAGVPGMVMTGPLNQLRILYLDPEGNLKLKTRGEDPPLLLSPGIQGLEVRHPVRGQVECLVTARADDRSEATAVAAVISGHVGNGFHGEGSTP